MSALPIAHDGCACPCHRLPGVRHALPCCGPSRRKLDAPWPSPQPKQYRASKPGRDIDTIDIIERIKLAPVVTINGLRYTRENGGMTLARWIERGAACLIVAAVSALIVLLGWPK